MLLTQSSGQAFISQLPSFSYHDIDSSPLNRVKLTMVASSGSEGVYSPTSTKRRRPRMPSPSAGHRNNRQPEPQPQPLQQEQKRIDETKTFGEAIQSAHSISDHLFAAEKFIWLPTDENLQPHLRTQLIHHEKRRRWGSQLLEGLGRAALSSWQNDSLNFKQKLLSSDDPEGKIWTDERLTRAIMSVALPMGLGNKEEATINRPEKEGAWISATLKGLHTLSGCIFPKAPSYASPPLEMQTWINLHRGISMLIQSADELSKRSALKDAIEVRFAIRGLVVRLEMANTILSTSDAKLEKSLTNCNNWSVLDFTSPNLNARTSNLPFDVFSHCLPWQMSPSSCSNYYGYPTQDLLPTLLQSIPFRFDTLTTRHGQAVIERRGTAWLAEEGIGALAYSGKLMQPSEVPVIVGEIMREIEQSCVERGQRQISSQIIMPPLSDSSSETLVEFKWDGFASPLYDELTQCMQPEFQPFFFDCALCNHYPDGDSACKFHTDPEHGTHWHRTTAVVSCGTSRMFAFRPIPDVTTWSEWDEIDRSTPVKAIQQNENAPVALQLFPGDVVFMTGSCNDDFHHAVYSSPLEGIAVNNSRVSLVLKRALDRGGGRRGHGLAGEGRRSRQRNSRQ